MTKKETLSIEERNKLYVKYVSRSFNFCMGFSLIFFIILLFLIIVIYNSIPQGTWECVEWEENYYVSDIPTYCVTGINCSRTSTYWVETCESYEYLNIFDFPQCKAESWTEKVCIKEQLVRSVTKQIKEVKYRPQPDWSKCGGEGQEPCRMIIEVYDEVKK